jgi:hypothetical protein
MLAPQITQLNYTYKKPDTEVWVLNFDDIPVPTEKIKDRQIVHLAPQSVGGNHKHPRTEWFVGIGELEFVWLDENGHQQKTHMNPNGEILLIEVPPFLAHAVRNISATERAVLIEFADGKMVDVEKVEVS